MTDASQNLPTAPAVNQLQAAFDCAQAGQSVLAVLPNLRMARQAFEDSGYQEAVGIYKAVRVPGLESVVFENGGEIRYIHAGPQGRRMRGYAAQLVTLIDPMFDAIEQAFIVTAAGGHVSVGISIGGDVCASCDGCGWDDGAADVCFLCDGTGWVGA